MNLEQLNEVFVLGNKRPQEDDHVVAFRQWVWVGDVDDQDIIDDINDKLNLDINDLFDMDQVTLTRPEILYGRIEGGDLLIQTNKSFFHSNTSVDVKKVMKALGLRWVKFNSEEIYGDGNEVEVRSLYDFDDITAPLSKKKFYHGTATAHYDKISTLGIKGTDKTNFEKIHHENKVFVTTNLSKAFFHAITAANKSDSYPIILQVKIPDIDKLVLDYDVAIDLFGLENDEVIRLGYDDIVYKSGKLSFDVDVDRSDIVKVNREFGLNTKLGIFGYSGRIPASHIEKVIYDVEILDRIAQSQIHGEDLSGEITFDNLENWRQDSIAGFEQEVLDKIEEYEEVWRDEEEDEDY